ncbi:MAG TPA: hypothetical protein VNX29_24515 [Kaistia sp.]|nr:hypothetical protein [Kaistia sp.]
MNLLYFLPPRAKHIGLPYTVEWQKLDQFKIAERKPQVGVDSYDEAKLTGIGRL